MLARVEKRRAITRPELHRRLRAWISNAGVDSPIGDVLRNQGRTAWVWVLCGAEHYRLHADSNASGVRRYLELLDRCGDGILWSVVLSQQGRPTKVAFGPDREVIPGFYLYRPAD